MSRLEKSKSSIEEKQVFRYEAPWPIYAMDWSNKEFNGHRLAIGSFLEDTENKLQIITRAGQTKQYATRNQPDFVVLAETSCYYPITKVLWTPVKERRESDLIVTSSDQLRVYELIDTGRGHSIVRRRELAHVKQNDFCAPITSFDWNKVDTSLVVTSSIDTTCTVWNIETGQATTQLIAHDRDVYDVAFMHQSPDMFASVGADGTIRLFDLRALENSTIVYESPPIHNQKFASAISNGSQPLLRIEFNHCNPNLLATFSMDSDSIKILDIRYPTAPVIELMHKSIVNCFNWAPNSPDRIVSGGDDHQIQIWDTVEYYNQRHSETFVINKPHLNYTAPEEIHCIRWNTAIPNWIAIGFGRMVQTVHI
ncbi:ddb1 and cul4 associated factor 7 [Rhizopus azygosporus]|uniref:Ddb1 and cul4 associated factor 7 n=1 Tax=Rhizopus azygosporus TaxID=86630 RepID=A0A367JTE1_RHIAZ|nr:ddb1 and cul4 associated factor 7 [Rhizopus azygosporus]